MGAIPKIGALDLALTKIGWAVTRESGTPWAGVIRPRGRGIPRLDDGLRQCVHAMRGCELVVIEGYSYASEYSQAHSLGEMGGVVKLGLWQMIPRPAIAIITPASVKLFATGKGDAKKPQMIEAARAHLGYGRHNDNEADAHWILQCALTWYGLSDLERTPEQLEALKKGEWPDINFVRYTGPHLEF